ncbi:MAG TPA: DUF5713 family protein [Chitinophagaceae bacterium]|jgi:hypothetical protein
MAKAQTELDNPLLKDYAFLKEMHEDNYFPKRLVDKGKAVLIELCFQIEETHPKTLEDLCQLTHTATDRFNDLQEEFEQNDSEIETVARESIAADFEFIARSYGFQDADVEDLIATRDW